jgi:hypothetical protein
MARDALVSAWLADSRMAQSSGRNRIMKSQEPGSSGIRIQPTTPSAAVAVTAAAARPK